MENSLKQGSPEATKLMAKADKLEAVECLLHGSAYQPVHLAIRFLRRLAQQTTFPDVIATTAVQELIEKLRKFAGTVPQPAEARMMDAALTLEQFC